MIDQVAWTLVPTAGSPARRGPKPPPEAAGALVVGGVVVGEVAGPVALVVVLGVVVAGVATLGELTSFAGAAAVCGLAASGPQAPRSTAPAITTATLRFLFRLRITRVVGGPLRRLDGQDHAE